MVLRVLEGDSCGEYFFSDLSIMPSGPGGLLKECLLQLFFAAFSIISLCF